MKQTKRKRNNRNYSNDKNKRKKLEDRIITNNSRSCFTNFEDLSNELIYEIFDLLDNYHVYQAFFDLNKRFENLLIHSILPIKIDILSMSKSNFQDYYSNIIKPNKHRITSLCLSDLFMIDIILSPPSIISKFIRLKTLILDHIETKHLVNVLKYSFSLPNLSSLIINPIDYVDNPNNIYRQIFRLPALKYCKISGYTIHNSKLLPNVTNQQSPIKHLVIENSVYYDVLDILLSNLPQLRYLTLNCLHGSFCKRKELSAMRLNNLTHISIEFHEIYFIQFEKLIKDSFTQIEVLRITANRDVTYLNANRWEPLILSYMINLRVFDMNYQGSIYCDDLTCDILTDNFNSSFWNERKSIFIVEKGCHGNISIKIFYSIDLSKYKTNYKSFKINGINSCLIQSKIIQNSIDHVYICSKKALDNCENYFLNVKNLIFDYNFDTPYHSFTTNLNRVISLSTITTLIIKCDSLRFTQLIQILRFTSNLSILKFPFLSLSGTDYTSIQQNESFIFVSNTNNIKTLSLVERSTLESARFILNLFPRLKHFKTGIDRKELKSCVSFLLSTSNNNNNCGLYFLCISSVPKLCLAEVKRVIKSEKLLYNYLIKYINRDLYLWW